MADIGARCSEEHDLTLFVARGRVAADELVAALERHLGAKPTNNVIWDLCDSDLSEVDTAGLTRVSDCARRLSEKRPNPRTIFVVRHDQEKFLLRLYEEISELRGSPIRYDLFRSRNKAYRALQLDDPFAEGMNGR